MGDGNFPLRELPVSDELKRFAEEARKELRTATESTRGWLADGEAKGVNIYRKLGGVTLKCLGQSADYEPHSAHKFFVEITSSPLNRFFRENRRMSSDTGVGNSTIKMPRWS